jgi:hypothetical protein
MKDCRECQHVFSCCSDCDDWFSSDRDYHCNFHTKLREIAGYVQFHENVPIPKWCPLLKKVTGDN